MLLEKSSPRCREAAGEALVLRPAPQGGDVGPRASARD